MQTIHIITFQYQYMYIAFQFNIRKIQAYNTHLLTQFKQKSSVEASWMYFPKS